jgi:hypothetical protein
LDQKTAVREQVVWNQLDAGHPESELRKEKKGAGRKRNPDESANGVDFRVNRFE